MQMSRLATLALLAVCAASALGCRTAGVNDLARPDPVLAPKTAVATEILAEHNRNAERIQVLEAQPDLTVTVYDPDKGPSSGSVDGRLTMERPRNFDLALTQMGSLVAHIGSNDNEYWFWYKGNPDKAIYYCKYDETGASPLAATFQPDWIIEAMGLRVIPEAEAAEISVKPGEAGKLVLTHRPHKAGAQMCTRVTIIDKTTHQILEHQILSADQKTLLARAVVPEGYTTVPVPAEPGGGVESVSIPKRLKLYWIQEKLDLDVAFRHPPKVNTPIKQSRREYLFVEPTPGRGYARKNLADLATAPGASGTTTIRETRPAPPSGSGVRLGVPAPIEDDAALRDDRRRSRNPVALGGSEPMVPSLADEIVGARLPTAPEP